MPISRAGFPLLLGLLAFLMLVHAVPVDGQTIAVGFLLAAVALLVAIVPNPRS